MIRVIVETRPVYRSEVGRRGRLTRAAAYRDAAWQAWRAKYPCECDGETAFVCWQHEREDDIGADGDVTPGGGGALAGDGMVYRRKVIKRLARWLMWRDAKTSGVARARRSA